MTAARSHHALARDARSATARIWAMFLGLSLLLASAIGLLSVILALWVVGGDLLVDPDAPRDFSEQLHIARQKAELPLLTIFLSGMAVSLAVVFAAALFKSVSLAGDGASLARSMGGVEVTPSTGDRRFQRLRNIVEEASLAAAIPTPRIFVLRHETGINAFAAGQGPGRAVVAVTHGALACLDRDELTAVVAHELAHIRNADVAINVKAFSMVHGLMFLSVIGYGLFRGTLHASAGGSRSRQDGRLLVAILIFAAALMLVGFLGSIMGRVLQASLSRQREFLADASAAGYTGNPKALASALGKIHRLAGGNRMLAGASEEAQHMLLSRSSEHLVSKLLATHPPLAQRIFRLDPGFSFRRDPVEAGERRTMAREVRAKDGPWGRRAG